MRRIAGSSLPSTMRWVSSEKSSGSTSGSGDSGELIAHDALLESVTTSGSMIEVSNAMLTNVTFKTIKADECAGVNAFLAMLKGCQFDDISGTTVSDEAKTCTVTSS